VVVRKRISRNSPPAELSEAEKKARAERLAIRAQAQREDAPRAMKEYRAAEEAMRQKTVQLRAARLAREALKRDG